LAKRTAKFACAALAVIFGCTALTLLPRVSAAAADDCLTEPTGDKPDGQQWRYRFEHGSNRRCWYLKDVTAGARDNAKDLAPRQATQPRSAWDFAQPAAPKFTLGRADRPAPRAGAEPLADDARTAAKAQPGATPSLIRTQAAASSDDGAQQSAGVSSWQPLDSADMDATASSAAASPPAPDEPAPASEPATSQLAVDAPVAVPVKAPQPVAPIQKLLMVVIGALSLSGLLASAVYRLSKVGRRRRRNLNWQRALARARRNRDKPRGKSKVKVVQGGIRAGRPTKRPSMAPAAAAKRAAPPAPAVAVTPTPAVARSQAAVDHAAELADLLASRAAKAASRPAAATPSHPVEPMHAALRSDEIDPAAELVDLLGSHAARRAAQPPAAAESAPPTMLANAQPPLPGVSDPAAELVDLLQSRFAPPPARLVRPAAARARPQPPTAPIHTAAPEVVESITELTNLLEAKDGEQAARLKDADAVHRIPPHVTDPEPATDRAAEPFDRPPASPVPHPIRAAQPMTAAWSAPEAADAAPPLKLAQPGKAGAARRRKVAPAARIDVAPAHAAEPAAEPIQRRAAPERAVAKADAPNLDNSNAGSSMTGRLKAAKNARRKDAELPLLPPALMLEPENNGPTPPLDFIPRPHALRPRVPDIRQDESLDGVQDILARLAKKG
jgi:hypothetical protein